MFCGLSMDHKTCNQEAKCVLQVYTRFSHTVACILAHSYMQICHALVAVFCRGDRVTDKYWGEKEWGHVLWDIEQKLPSISENSRETYGGKMKASCCPATASKRDRFSWENGPKYLPQCVQTWWRDTGNIWALSLPIKVTLQSFELKSSKLSKLGMG